MKKCLKPNILLLFLLLTAGVVPSLNAETQPDAAEKASFDTFTLYWENDIFAGTDRDYTNGLKLSWSTPFLKDRKRTKLPDWSYSLIRRIPFAYNPEGEQSLTISLGQNIYTPVDIYRTDLIVDDRPYAGHMYLGAAIHSRNGTSKNVWELNIGVLGPASYADDLQRWLHKNTGSDPAQGWENQLDNEPTLDVGFETKWRLLKGRLSRRLIYDVITHLGGRAGNVAVYANTGAEVRVGFGLPDNFGICTIRGGCAINSAFEHNGGRNHGSFHVFASVDGRAVAHDIFLDGNTVADSHSVDKEPLVGELVIGFAFETGPVLSTYSYIFRTRQFKEQQEAQEYGAITVSIRY